MLDKLNRRIISMAASSAGVPSDRIAHALALLDGRSECPSSRESSLLVNQTEVCFLLGCSRWTVRRLAAGGSLHPRRVLGGVRFLRREVEEFAAGGGGKYEA